MKIKELKQKSKDELEKLLEENRSQLLELKFNLVSGRVKNVKNIKNIKKDIAKILTIIK